tara:strand:+ start:458 stop:697 length:240 start_codon:yes stop_codon:yes gene_type:complete
MSSLVFSKVVHIISSILDIPVESVEESSSPNSIKKWDSVNHLNIILALEEEFNLKFSKDEIESMISVKIINSTIESFQE